MEQLSIRDWMVIIGGVMIAAVLVDAARRFWRERHAEIRLNARIERSRSVSDDDDAFNLLTELPNGGARIVRRDDLGGDDIDDLEPGNRSEKADVGGDEASHLSVGAEGQAIEAGGEDRDFISVPDPIDVAVERDEIEQAGGASGAPGADAEPDVDVDDFPDADEAAASPRASRRRTVKPPSDLPAKSAGDDSAPGTVDWLDSMEPEALSEEDSVEQGRLPRGANTHVFILYVVARSEEGFAGMDILEALLACDLRFGDMDFFHRHERASGRGPIEFSVANMMKPGVFDIDNMEPLQTRGLMFFVTLPGPSDMLKAFDYMYETTKVIAKALDGDIQDEKRSVVTRSSLEHMRQQIRELERRLLVRRT